MVSQEQALDIAKASEWFPDEDRDAFFARVAAELRFIADPTDADVKSAISTVRRSLRREAAA